MDQPQLANMKLTMPSRGWVLSAISLVFFALLSPAGAVVIHAPSDLEAEFAGEGALPDEAPKGVRRLLDRFSGQYRAGFYREEQDGGGARTFRPEEWFIEQNLTLDAEKTLRSGHRWGLSLSARQTDDPALNRGLDDVRLTNFRTTLSDPGRWDFAFGNVLGNLTRYTFSRSFEGLSYVGHVRDPKMRGQLDVTALFGRTQRAVQYVGAAPQPLRYAYGGGLDWRGRDLWIFPEARLRLAYAGIKDDRESVDGVPNTADENGVVAVAADVSFGKVSRFDLTGWTAATEIASSSLERALNGATTAPKSGYSAAADLSYRRPDDRPYAYEGGGFKWFAERLLNPIQTRFQWEQADKDFTSALGSSASDLLRWISSSEWSFDDWGTVRTASANSRDGLGGGRPFYNTNRSYSLDWNFHPMRAMGFDPARMRWASLYDLDLSLSSRYTNRFATNRTADLDIEDYRALLAMPIRGWRASLELSRQITVDHARSFAAEQDRRGELVAVSLARSITVPRDFLFFPVKMGGWMLDPAGWNVSPSLTLRQTRDNGFGANFRTTRTRDADFRTSIAPPDGDWNFRAAYGLQNRSEGNLNVARSESDNTNLDFGYGHRLPWIRGAEASASWNRKVYGTKGTGPDYAVDSTRVDLRVPF